MDVNYEFGEYKFVWDSDKNEKNYRKHGIYFEDRFKIIGKIRDVLVVIYTERDDRKRIISARLAEKFEKEAYYEQFYF